MYLARLDWYTYCYIFFTGVSSVGSEYAGDENTINSQDSVYGGEMYEDSNMSFPGAPQETSQDSNDADPEMRLGKCGMPGFAQA